MNEMLRLLEGKSDREIECILAEILFRHGSDRQLVRGERLYYEGNTSEDQTDPVGEPVPCFCTTWDGFGLALELIWKWDFNVHLVQTADSSTLPKAIVSQRMDEEAVHAEASHQNLRRALAIAAILVMDDAFKATRCERHPFRFLKKPRPRGLGREAAGAAH